MVRRRLKAAICFVLFRMPHRPAARLALFINRVWPAFRHLL